MGTLAMLLHPVRGSALAAAVRHSSRFPGFVRIPAYNYQQRAGAAATTSRQARQRVPCAAAPAPAAAPEVGSDVSSSPPSASPSGPGLVNIYELGEDALGNFLQSTLGQPKYRAKQVRAWLYERGARSFEEMQDLPKALRASLAEHFRLGR